MTYRAPGLNKARTARKSRAYRARKREAARCSECGLEIAEISACTCERVQQTPPPIKQRSIMSSAGGVH